MSKTIVNTGAGTPAPSLVDLATILRLLILYLGEVEARYARIGEQLPDAACVPQDITRWLTIGDLRRLAAALGLDPQAELAQFLAADPWLRREANDALNRTPQSR